MGFESFVLSKCGDKFHGAFLVGGDDDTPAPLHRLRSAQQTEADIERGEHGCSSAFWSSRQSSRTSRTNSMIAETTAFDVSGLSTNPEWLAFATPEVRVTDQTPHHDSTCNDTPINSGMAHSTSVAGNGTSSSRARRDELITLGIFAC